MIEEVQTGGLKKFSYPKETPKLKEEYKKEINEAYEVYYERKREEKKRKKLIWLLLALLLVIIIVVILLVK
jgi:flagellar basal body-associated protein FliL